MGQIKALRMSPGDNVAVCVAAAAPGDEVVATDPDGARVSVPALEAIPFCHKIALADLPEGAEVIKYGESIGRLSRPAPRGGLVDHTNLVSQRRDYADEYVLRGGRR